MGIGILAVLTSCTVPALDPAAVPGENERIRTIAATVPEPIRARSFDILDGAFWSIGSDALPTVQIDTAEVQAKSDARGAVFLIHGTMYDPRDPGLGNPHLTLYVALRSMFGDGVGPIVGMGWNSISFTLGNLLTAWRNGHATWYGLATRRAAEAVEQLHDAFAARRSRYSVVCHSIGCHVAWQAVVDAKHPPDRLLMLSPDTDYAALQDWALERDVEVLHVTASQDVVLTFSQFARRNRGFVPRPGQDRYRMHVVDVDTYLPSVRRISFRYTNPRRFGDHMAVTELPHLIPLYRRFLLGQ